MLDYPIPFLGVVAVFGIGTTQIGQIGVACLVAGLAYIQHRFNKDAKAKQQEIHVLVNSRLSEALSEIQTLKNLIEKKDAVIADQTVSKD
jgi:hypothetical protein